MSLFNINLGSKDKINKWIFKAYTFLFIFQLVNRGLEIGFFDTRIVIVIISLYLIGLKIIDRRKRKKACTFNFTDYLFLILYSLAIISVIPFLIFSNIYDSSLLSDTLNLVILNLYGLLTGYTFILFKKDITFDLVFSSLRVAFLFNVISIVYVHFSVAILDITPQLLTNQQYIYRGNHTNFFGGNYRIGGYGVDPNYVSVTALTLLCFYVHKGKNITNLIKNNLFSIILIVYAFGISASKTVLLVSIVVFFCLYVANKIKVKPIYYSVILVLGFIFLMVIPGLLKNSSINESMLTRVNLWSRAISMGLEKPFLGGGISSFRHSVNQIGWPVQAHSTFFQILSEHGFVVLFIWLLIVNRNILYLKLRSNAFVLLYTVFCLWSLTYETMYLPQFVFFNVVLINVVMNINSNDKIKVVNVTNGLATGGAERIALDLANGVTSKEIESYLMITDPTLISVYDEKLHEGDFKIIDISKRKHDILGNNIRALNVLGSDKFKVIHTHQITLMYMLFSLMLLSDISWIHTIHSDAQKEFGSKIFRVFYHVLFVLFNIQIVSISSYVLEGAKKEYFLCNKNQFYLIYNGSNIDSNNKSLSLKEGELYKIVCVGRLTEVKNYELVLEVSKELKLRNIEHIIEIYGEGELYEDLLERIKMNGLSENVKLMGVTKDIHLMLKEQTLFLMTSKFEGFGLAAVEAMSVGLPVVLTNFGPADELVSNDYNGFISTKYDAEEISDFIEIILSTRYPEFSHNALVASRKFSREKMIEEYRKLYERI